MTTHSLLITIHSYFLPFFSRKKRGTGMGLAIVHRIVSDHNGAIRVADNFPRGTVFTIELPAR